MAVLFPALAALFAAITLGVLAVVLGEKRTRATAALATMDKAYGASSAALASADLPLAERVGLLTARFSRLGRALTPAGSVARLERRLELAGSPAAWPVERVVQAKGLLLIVVGLWWAYVGVRFGGIAGLVGGGLLGGAVGALLPGLLVHNLALRRQQQMRNALPDILDVLTISVEAGLGFDAALAQVAMNGRGPMHTEIGRVLQEMQIGAGRADALRALASRTTITELRTFTASIVQATELGIPIAQVLREQAKEMRVLRRQRAEEAAQKVPIKILFPLVFCLFPALFVVIIGPGALRIMDAFS
jgi:tight adherence protein C